MVYREDENYTLDKRATFNLSVMRKVCLPLLQMMTFPQEKFSYRRKHRYISVHLEDYLATEENVTAQRWEQGLT